MDLLERDRPLEDDVKQRLHEMVKWENSKHRDFLLAMFIFKMFSGSSIRGAQLP